MNAQQMTLFTPGTRVRIKANPSRVGFARDETQTLGPLVKQRIDFIDGASQFLAPGQLEIVNEDPVDWVEFLRKRQFAGAKELKQSFVFHRLTGSVADMLYSMDATNTDYYPYQYKPLLNFLDSPSRGLLIADEVGLGKTIEAGIIWTELKARYDDSCLLVVCPAMLTEKWKLELRRRFSINAEICSADELRKRLEENVRGEAEDFAIICSIQGIRPPRRAKGAEAARRGSDRLNEFFEEQRNERYLFDLVIVDEAHYMRNSESLARRLGEYLRDLAKNLLLLSATPIQMRSLDLYNLLSLLDPDTFVSVESFEEVLLANEPIIRLRDGVMRGDYSRSQFLEHLEDAGNRPALRNSRQLLALRESVLDDDSFESPTSRSRIAEQLERINFLSHVVSRTRKRDVHEFKVIRRSCPEFIEMSSLERCIYDEVTKEIKRFCAFRKDLPEGFALSTPQRQISSSVPAAIQNWRQRGLAAGFEEIEYTEEDANIESDSFGPLVGKMIQIASGIGDLERLEREDTKFRRLAKVVSGISDEDPREKVIVFSYFKPTLKYLARRLEDMGYRCLQLHGDVDEPKDELISRFRERGDLQILLSSEVASEGVDLQFCRVMINYDLPWNPMQIEQRIGRIDRIGQSAETIAIWNLFYAETIDARIYERLLTRLGIFERALGGVETVIGDEIANLTNELTKNDLTEEEQYTRIAQTEQAIANIQAQNERLENEAAAMVAHADTILKEVAAVRDLQRYVRPRDLWDFVSGVLRTHFPSSRFVLKDEERLVCDIKLCAGAQFEFENYLRSRKSRIRTALINDRDKTRQYRFITRSENLGATTEAITNFHPFVRFLGERLAKDGIPNYPPVAVRLQSFAHPELEQGVHAFMVKKLMFQGAKTQEWLKFSASKVGSGNVVVGDEAERLVGLAATRGQDWLIGAGDISISELENALAHCEMSLDADMEFQVRCLDAENMDRVELQLRNVTRKFDQEILRNEDVLDRMLREGGKQRGVKLRRALISSLDEKKRKRIFELEQARQTVSDSTRLVAVGVIEVS